MLKRLLPEYKECREFESTHELVDILTLLEQAVEQVEKSLKKETPFKG
jgi:hypothetical protein